MELYEAIEKRRTVRVYKEKATEDQLRKIILAGSRAPSAANRQPWEFIIVDDQEAIDRLAELKYQLNRKEDPDRPQKNPAEREEKARLQQKYFQNAAVVAVCHQVEWERSLWLCIENMSLAALEEGLGSCIVMYWEKEKKAAEKLLKIPDSHELTAIIKFGVPEKEQHPAPKRRPEFSWLHKNRFGEI
jgi:nitroreductase